MAEVEDGYPAYYAERLWQLLPAVYRTLDTDSFGVAGPLRELVDRIGNQVAAVRRSVDRLWEDQSIETCDDWVIPYIADLLGTNLVNSLDTAGQRLDVANTIHYRRRKGTVAVLEELAWSVTGWPAHVVEGFRRLGRSRHGLDPGLGAAAYPSVDPDSLDALLQAEGIVGPRTGTLAGGFLDLRDAHGASLVGSAFDEAFHHADVRAGTAALGHFGIRKLLVFLWRLSSSMVTATPVEVSGSNGLCWVFDPTGREVPLFLPQPAPPDDVTTPWAPAEEWQVPGPLTSALAALLVQLGLPLPFAVQGASFPVTRPYPFAESGRFATAAAPAEGTSLSASYCYGSPSTVGAGTYDRNLLGDPPVQVAPVEAPVSGGAGLDVALSSAPASSTVVIGDSLTYGAVAPVGSSEAPIGSFLCQAAPLQRPVIRVPGGAPWVFTGGPGAVLVLDGLLVSGCDVVLRGAFSSVRLTACTIDPGTAAPGAGSPGEPELATAVDGALLGPSRIFVEADPNAAPGSAGAIESLSLDHCVTGPIRTRAGGSIETLSLSDTIVQAVATSTSSSYTAADVYDPLLLAKAVLADDPLSRAVAAILSPAATSALQALLAGPAPAGETPVEDSVLDGLNALVAADAPLYAPGDYPSLTLDPATTALYDSASSLDPADLAVLNRQLLDAAFPIALGLAALAVADATVELARVSVLGPSALHRLSASDSLLTGLAVVDDVQDGCVRFSATVLGSRVPRQYRSAQVAGGAGIFTSDAFGDPAYCQLLDSADGAVVGGSSGATLRSGADSGSEIGAYSGDYGTVKEQALLIKYQEYLPLGLDPVVIHVT